MELTALVRDAANGDEQAWSALVDRFAGLVWSVARAHSLDDADAADVSQTTWLRLAESLPTLREPERLSAWLVTCTRRESLRVLRQRHRDVVMARPEDSHQLELSPEEELFGGVHEELKQALARLPEQSRALLHAMFMGPDLSYAQLSEMLGIPIGSIGPSRARSLAKIREHMRALLGTEARDEGAIGSDGRRIS